MNLRWAAILALALAPVTLFAAEGTFDRTLSVNGPASLNVSTGSGYIHITPGPDGSIHIIGHVHASMGWLGGSAEDRVRHVTDNPPIVQNGNNIDVGQHTHFENVSIDYVITAPRGTTVQANSGSGDLNISNLGAPLKAGTGSGDIEANDLTGDIALNTGSGDIRAMMNGAHYVKAETGSGTIRLQGVSGGLFAETGSGDIEVGGQPGDGWKLETGSGSVTLNTGSNAHFSLDASTGSGDVHSDPPLTTHGNMDRHHITGDINGGGPIVRVETGSGDVRIH
jgi:Putative adhesin